MKTIQECNHVDGFFSLQRLKPIFFLFSRTDMSCLLNASKEEAEVIWSNSTIKAVFKFPSNADNAKKSGLPRNFKYIPTLKSTLEEPEKVKIVSELKTCMRQLKESYRNISITDIEKIKAKAIGFFSKNK